jgi:hypothetical protein
VTSSTNRIAGLSGVALLAGALLSMACGMTGRGRFPNRAPLLTEPEKPFSPAPPKSTIGDRAGALDDLTFAEWDRKLAFQAKLSAQT